MRQHDVKYDLRDNAPIDGDAEKIGAALEEIEDQHGRLEPEVVVAAASDESSPLHDYFTWEDHKAAQKQRKREARKLIRSVVVKTVDNEEPEGPTRAFVNVQDTDGRGYESTTVAMRSESKRDQVLRRFREKIHALRTQFGHLEEFAELMQSLSEAEERAEELVEV